VSLRGASQITCKQQVRPGGYVVAECKDRHLHKEVTSEGKDQQNEKGRTTAFERSDTVQKIEGKSEAGISTLPAPPR